jgi:peptidylprolyl isomerase
MRLHRLIALGLATAALVAAGCSEETTEEAAKKDGSQAADLREETGVPPPTPGEPRKKPRVTIPDRPPPKKLQIKDLIKGRGAAVKAGSNLSVNYVGVSYSNGREFDTSFGKQPLEFPLGSGQVIPGWDEGLSGMKVGGRRQLTIPPSKAYGAQGQPPVIGPDETLVFIVDLLSAK